MFPGGDMETGGEFRISNKTLWVTFILPQIIYDNCVTSAFLLLFNIMKE